MKSLMCINNFYLVGANDGSDVNVGLKLGVYVGFFEGYIQC